MISGLDVSGDSIEVSFIFQFEKQFRYFVKYILIKALDNRKMHWCYAGVK
jgi:hypothetical protein